MRLRGTLGAVHVRLRAVSRAPPDKVDLRPGREPERRVKVPEAPTSNATRVPRRGRLFPIPECEVRLGSYRPPLTLGAARLFSPMGVRGPRRTSRRTRPRSRSGGCMSVYTGLSGGPGATATAGRSRPIRVRPRPACAAGAGRGPAGGIGPRGRRGQGAGLVVFPPATVRPPRPALPRPGCGRPAPGHATTGRPRLPGRRAASTRRSPGSPTCGATRTVWSWNRPRPRPASSSTMHAPRPWSVPWRDRGPRASWPRGGPSSRSGPSPGCWACSPSPGWFRKLLNRRERGRARVLGPGVLGIPRPHPRRAGPGPAHPRVPLPEAGPEVRLDCLRADAS